MNTELDDSTLEASVHQANKAQDAGDLAGALTAWDNVLNLFPAEPNGYSGRATTLRLLNRLDEADDIAISGLLKFPEDESIALEYAWIAHHRGDWKEAELRWRSFRNKFPAAFGGYFGGGAALRALKRFDEADMVYKEALVRWPRASNLLAGFAAVAQAQGDRAEASKRWNELRTQFPDQAEGYLPEVKFLRNCSLLKEAETLLSDAVARVPNNSAVLIEYAQIAQQRGAPQDALKRWESVINSFPGLVDGYVGATQALNDLGRYADAQNVLQPALRKFPDAINLHALHGWIAHYKREFSEALNRWANLRERFPTHVIGYIGGVVTYLAVAKFEEATKLAEEAMRSFPYDVHVAMDYARIPQQVQDWDEAVRRWASVHERFPSVMAVKTGYALNLLRAGKENESENLLETTIAQYPSDIDVLVSYAECASKRSDWSSAEIRWQKIIEQFPEHPAGFSGLAEMLRNAGRFSESENFLKEALLRFPNNIDLERQLAMTATLKREWPIALSLWAKLKEKYPANPAVLSGITQALWQARQDLGAATEEGEKPPFEIPANLSDTNEHSNKDNLVHRALFMKFESIGDTCEFGIVQRRFGAEPIGLLRWASTNPANLIKALDSRFEGVGEAEHTVIEVSHGEYITRDKRYHMFSHTFTPETAEPIEKFTSQHLRRMQFLRRKLVDDLPLGDKIFVYKSNHGLSDEEAKGIHDAIRRYGGLTALLCVRIEDELHKSGTLKLGGDGLFIGYIDRFSTVDINVDTWVSLCERTAELWKAMLENRYSN